MREDILRIETKIDKIVDRIGSIDSTLSAQHVSLSDHIRRTEILEKTVEPIKRHVAMVHGALKLLGAIAVLGGIVEATTEVLIYLKK